MANISLDWEVEGIISARESVHAMIEVIETKSTQASGKFYTWDGRVRMTVYEYEFSLMISPGASVVNQAIPLHSWAPNAISKVDGQPKDVWIDRFLILRIRFRQGRSGK